MKDSNSCIVHGCSNTKDGGTFIDNLCAPCYKNITSGVIAGVRKKNLVAIAKDSKGIHLFTTAEGFITYLKSVNGEWNWMEWVDQKVFWHD